MGYSASAQSPEGNVLKLAPPAQALQSCVKTGRAARRPIVTIKTALLAIAAAVALIGAAIIGVPSTSQKNSEPAQIAVRVG
jgi:hypothetical protein